MKLIAVPDPLMMVWAAVICVLLTAVRENLNRVLFKVSEGREEGEGKGGRAGGRMRQYCARRVLL